MRPEQFILLEAEEYDDLERDSSDGKKANDESSSRVTPLPPQYHLPSANASSHFDRLVHHLEEFIHRQRPSRALDHTDRETRTTLPLSPPPDITSDLDREQDWDIPYAVELTKEQRLLKHWIKKYLGDGGLAIFGYKLFYVRCQRQYEQSIINRIRTDIQDQNIDPLILRATFPSTLPGGIYLQAQSMLPQNITLASYLLTIPGLLYPKAPRVVFSAHESVHNISPAPSRTDLVLPIHSVIEDPASIAHILREPLLPHEYPPRTWIKCNRGLYQNDVGLVIDDDFNEINDREERLVLLHPRLDWSQVYDLSSGKTTLKRKRALNKRPDVLPWPLRELIARQFCVPAQLDCARHCKSSHSCDHSAPTQKRYICLEQYWQNGLVLVRVKLKDMDTASEMPADVRHYFLASNHPEVHQSLRSIPPPSSWEFRIGEAVRFTDFDGTWCTSEGEYPFELPAGQTEGVIHYVGSSYCEINIPLRGPNFTVNSLHILSKTHLEKIFNPGDIVLLLSGACQRLSLKSRNHDPETLAEAEEMNQEGVVISVGPAQVEVMLRDHHDEFLDFHPNTLTKVENSTSNQVQVRYRPKDHLGAPFDHNMSPATQPSTRAVPWKNLQVYPVKFLNKGYRAIVMDARVDKSTLSGLSVRIRFETQGMSNPFAWVDYDGLRRVDNNRFLHDIDGNNEAGSHTDWDSYWNLKPDYLPQYSAEERRLLNKGTLLEETAQASDSDITDGTLEDSSRPSTPCSSPPSTATDPAWDPCSPDPPRHWILDPRIAKGLPEDMELLVATTTNPGRDRKVLLRNINGTTLVYSVVGSRLGGRKPSDSDIVEVDPFTILETPRSLCIPSNAGIAKGLYLICSGNRTGLLCRRLTYMMRLDSSKPPRWLVQVVKVRRKPGIRVRFDETLDTSYGPQWVEAADLVAVHENDAMRSSANAQLDPIRRLYEPLHE
ncbi:hypothetical protein C8R42DRAFT_719412 [Lentinula raphanica]|nr:hypothetical protein C8R42DRAFT_719412 [Lentinula raphanica]